MIFFIRVESQLCLQFWALWQENFWKPKEDFSLVTWFSLRFNPDIEHTWTKYCPLKPDSFIALLFQSLRGLEKDGGVGDGLRRQMANVITTRKTGLSFKNDNSSILSTTGEIWKRIRKGLLKRKRTGVSGCSSLGWGWGLHLLNGTLKTAPSHYSYICTYGFWQLPVFWAILTKSKR